MNPSTGLNCMSLPELPKGHNRREAKIDGRVAQWFLDNYPRPVLLEVKVKGGRLKEHQKRLINKVAVEGKFKYKFPDGGRRTPLDYIVVPSGLVSVLAECDGNECVCSINNGKRIINIKV